jgi:hypothetical protein
VGLVYDPRQLSKVTTVRTGVAGVLLAHKAGKCFSLAGVLLAHEPENVFLFQNFKNE